MGIWKLEVAAIRGLATTNLDFGPSAGIFYVSVINHKFSNHNTMWFAPTAIHRHQIACLCWQNRLDEFVAIKTAISTQSLITNFDY